MLILAAAVALWSGASPVSAETATRPASTHSPSQMMPQFNRGIVPPMGSGIVPPLGPGIVPPLGPDMVPPLVSGTCCRNGFDRERPHRFPFFPFVGGVYVNQPPNPAAPSAPSANLPQLPPPPPDFEPRLVTLKPFAARPSDPASVTILRAGEPGEVVKFAGTAH
jgi:hypothetical protein